MENIRYSSYASAKKLFSSILHLKDLYVRNLTLNNTNSTIKGIYTGTVTYSSRSISPGSTSSSNFTIPGISVGDICIVNSITTPGTHCFIDEGYISAENTLTILGKCTHDATAQNSGNIEIRYFIVDIT